MTSNDEQLPPGGMPIDNPVWESWHPAQLATLLREVTAPWYVAAGWALDLFCGQQTREHEDLEMGLPDTPEAFGQVRQALHSYDIEVAGGPPPGSLWPVQQPGLRPHAPDLGQ